MLLPQVFVRPLIIPFFDLFPGASAAYSLRQLHPDAIFAIRVRRSSDNQEQDIGFTSIGELDESALSLFVGSGDGFIVFWYDQSGNNNHASQSVASQQPKIVNTGTVISGGVFFDTTNKTLELPTVSTLGIQAANSKSIFAVIQTSVNTDGFIFLGSSSSSFASLRYRSSLSGSARIEIQSYGYTSAFPIADGNPHLFSSIFSGTQTQDFDISVDGVTENATGTNLVNTDGTKNMYLNLTGNFNTNLGYVKELILYPSDQSTNRTGIEGDINSYYSIY